MKLKLLYALLSAIIFCLHAQAQTPTPTLNKGTIADSSYYDEIPYEVVGGKLVVTVTVNNKLRKFVWDSGAPLLIGKDLFDELKPQVETVLPVTDAFGKKDSMMIVDIARLQIGNITFNNSAALVMNDQHKGFECMNIDGLIGSNIMRNSVVQIDSRRNLIIITNDESRMALDKAHRIDLIKTPMQSNPYIKIKLPSRVSVELLFDTGADDFLTLSNKNYDYISKEKKKSLQVIDEGWGHDSYGIHGHEEQTKKYKLFTKNMTLANTSFEQVHIETMDDNDSRIGAKLLNHGLITIDYKNSSFYFQPFDNKNKIDVAEKDWLIKPIEKDGKIVAGMIWNRAGDDVKYGDEIIAIDGISTNDIDICDLFLKKIIPQDKQSITFTIKGSDGISRDIVNKKQ